MRYWAKVGLTFILIVAGAVVFSVAQGKPEVGIRCEAKGGSGSCKIENKGAKAGDFAVDVILVCHDGEHSAHLSGSVDAGNHVTKIIDGFSPDVGLLTKCEGIDYRNFKVK